MLFLEQPPAPDEAPHADGDEGQGEYLSHVYGQAGLEGLLYLLGVLNEEAEGEDEGEAEAEVESLAHALRPQLAVDEEYQEEETEVGQ